MIIRGFKKLTTEYHCPETYFYVDLHQDKRVACLGRETPLDRCMIIKT